MLYYLGTSDHLSGIALFLKSQNTNDDSELIQFCEIVIKAYIIFLASHGTADVLLTKRLSNVKLWSDHKNIGFIAV